MGGVLYEDTLNKPTKHAIKHSWWSAHGVAIVRIRFDGTHEQCPVSFGDYYAPGSNRVVDTKRSVDEIAQNINGKQHARFKRECQRAQGAGFRLVVLIENDLGYSSFGDVAAWTNGHCLKCGYYRGAKCEPRNSSTKCMKHGTKKPIQGDRLAKAMETMQGRYGVRFVFCKPQEAAEIICKLLGVMYE